MTTDRSTDINTDV